jgi:hypothetical protein
LSLKTIKESGIATKPEKITAQTMATITDWPLRSAKKTSEYAPIPMNACYRTHLMSSFPMLFAGLTPKAMRYLS